MSNDLATPQIFIPAWVDGKLTPIEKIAAHQKGLRHLAVSVFVVAGDSILIQQRALTKYHTPGLWANTCCTHPEWGENPSDCATRRLVEELGIVDLKLEHRGQVEYRADVGNNMVEHEVVEVFLAHATRALPLRPNPDEVMATRWVSHWELTERVQKNPALYTPWMRIYLEQHADLIFGDALNAAHQLKSSA